MREDWQDSEEGMSWSGGALAAVSKKGRRGMRSNGGEGTAFPMPFARKACGTGSYIRVIGKSRTFYVKSETQDSFL